MPDDRQPLVGHERAIGRSTQDGGIGVPADTRAAERVLLFEGRTGRGDLVRVYEIGDWLDVLYYEGSDEWTKRGGFSLNPLYASEITVALVKCMAARAGR